MAGYAVRFTGRLLDEWRRKWPCSTLEAGTAYFDAAGDLVDMTGRLAQANVDGHEFDAFVDDHQGPRLALARGKRCV